MISKVLMGSVAAMAGGALIENVGKFLDHGFIQQQVQHNQPVLLDNISGGLIFCGWSLIVMGVIAAIGSPESERIATSSVYYVPFGGE